ncbi:MAG: hypothetical protein WED81_07420, partial [Rhodothermales bacterium]
MRITYLTTLVIAAATSVVLLGCDSDITGAALENEPPDTQLSVRDTSLVENLGGDDRLSSTVFVTWSGTDRDGFVPRFQIRFYQRTERPGPEERWSETTRNDSLVLLPIPRGERIADVVFEARAVDNQGIKDPTPARTVFPIKNSPPAVRLSIFDLPPDTTFQIFSFAWAATDPEGEENLDRIEVSLNDTLNFVPLPADVTFATFVGQLDANQPNQGVAEARVFTGRGFAGTDIRVPNLLLDAENTFYIRAVDRTDTTSTMDVFTWYVKGQKSDVLYVNDYRISTNTILLEFHSQLLSDYLPLNASFDVWDITRPFVSGNVGNVPRSSSLPPAADPTLRRMLAQWKHIYWVSTNTINSTAGNNLPYVADVMDLFFENGGTLMVHSPISLPNDPEENLGNAALLLLPLTGLITFPDSLRPSLRINTGAEVDPTEPVPGLQQQLPPLVARGFQLNTLPYFAQGANTIPLYSAEYQYVTREGNRRGPWPGPSTVASMSADRRIGLFALPLIDSQN